MIQKMYDPSPIMSSHPLPQSHRYSIRKRNHLNPLLRRKLRLDHIRTRRRKDRGRSKRNKKCMNPCAFTRQSHKKTNRMQANPFSMLTPNKNNPYNSTQTNTSNSSRGRKTSANGICRRTSTPCPPNSPSPRAPTTPTPISWPTYKSVILMVLLALSITVSVRPMSILSTCPRKWAHSRTSLWGLGRRLPNCRKLSM